MEKHTTKLIYYTFSLNVSVIIATVLLMAEPEKRFTADAFKFLSGMLYVFSIGTILCIREAVKKMEK